MVNEKQQPSSMTVIQTPILIMPSLYKVLEYKLFKLPAKYNPSARRFIHNTKINIKTFFHEISLLISTIINNSQKSTLITLSEN